MFLGGFCKRKSSKLLARWLKLPLLRLRDFAFLLPLRFAPIRCVEAQAKALAIYREVRPPSSTAFVE
jgi:hypothetical protein